MLFSLPLSSVLPPFHSGNFTPVCTKQCNLIARPDTWEALSKYNCGVLGVSVDDPESHKKLMAKYNVSHSFMHSTSFRVFSTACLHFSHCSVPLFPSAPVPNSE